MSEQYYTRDAERFISQYNLYKHEIIDIDIKIALLQEEDGFTAVDTTNEPSSKTNKFNSLVENTAVRIVDAINILQAKKRALEGKLKRIDNAMETLDADEREIITRTAIMNEYYFQFIHEIFKSERNCKRIKRVGMTKIAKILYHS